MLNNLAPQAIRIWPQDDKPSRTAERKIQTQAEGARVLLADIIKLAHHEAAGRGISNMQKSRRPKIIKSAREYLQSNLYRHHLELLGLDPDVMINEVKRND